MNSKINKTIIPAPSGRNALKQAGNTLSDALLEVKAGVETKNRLTWQLASSLKIVRAELRKQSKAGKVVKLNHRKEAA